MKKILYLLALIAVVFTSCDPLSKTYKAIDALPQDGKNNTTPLAINLTTSYATVAAANTAIPVVLNATYSQYADGSVANVSFALPTNAAFAPDAVYSHVAYTLVASDYAYAGSTTATNLSATQVLAFLAYKYPTPVTNQLAVLTYSYFETGYSTGLTTTDAFLYLNGAWTKIYLVSPAQYTSVNRGLTNTFASADLANIQTYISDFLLADPTVSVSAKVGDTKYVSYRYATTSQYVIPMVYDGTKWASRSTLIFVKANGTWIPDPSIYYTFSKADYGALTNATVGTAAARANVISFGDFNIQSSTSTTYWADADLKAAIIIMLQAKFPAPVANNPYKITYAVYTGAVSNVTATYIYNGTTWVLQ